MKLILAAMMVLVALRGQTLEPHRGVAVGSSAPRICFENSSSGLCESQGWKLGEPLPDWVLDLSLGMTILSVVLLPVLFVLVVLHCREDQSASRASGWASESVSGEVATSSAWGRRKLTDGLVRG